MRKGPIVATLLLTSMLSIPTAWADYAQDMAGAGLHTDTMRNGNIANMSVVVDIDEMNRSHDFWKRHVPSDWDLRNIPLEVAFALSQSAISGVGMTFERVRDLRTVNVVASIRYENGPEKGDHEIYRYMLERNRFEDIGSGDDAFGRAQALLPPAQTTDWFNAAVKAEKEHVDFAEPLSVESVVLDKEKLIGQTIRVVGWAGCAGTDICVLYQTPGEIPVSIIFDASILQRGDRGRLLGCDALRPCQVYIVGRLTDGLLALKPVHFVWGTRFTGERAPDEQTPDPTKTMSPRDFAVDAKHLNGRTVTVRGSVACMDSTCWLIDGGNLTATATFDASKLPRDDRKRLLGCGPYAIPCTVIVTGVVSGPIINAQFLAWD